MLETLVLLSADKGSFGYGNSAWCLFKENLFVLSVHRCTLTILSVNNSAMAMLIKALSPIIELFYSLFPHPSSSHFTGPGMVTKIWCVWMKVLGNCSFFHLTWLTFGHFPPVLGHYGRVYMDDNQYLSAEFPPEEVSCFQLLLLSVNYIS